MIIMKREQQRFQCEICDADFEAKEFLLLHNKYHMDQKQGIKKRRKFKCDHCDVKVNSQYHLDIHKSKHEGNPTRKFVCEVCDRSFVAAQFLKSHMHTHSATSTINCKVCNKSFTGKEYLRLHMQLHNDIKKFKCTKCDEMLPSKTFLKVHMMKHTKIKNFKCDYCNKQFVSKISMVKHRGSHEGKTLDCHVKCSQCEYSMHASMLSTHMQRAHPDNNDETVKRPHKCLTCGKCFIVKINLNLHIRVCHPDLMTEFDDEDDED